MWLRDSSSARTLQLAITKKTLSCCISDLILLILYITRRTVSRTPSLSTINLYVNVVSVWCLTSTCSLTRTRKRCNCFRRSGSSMIRPEHTGPPWKSAILRWQSDMFLAAFLFLTSTLRHFIHQQLGRKVAPPTLSEADYVSTRGNTTSIADPVTSNTDRYESLALCLQVTRTLKTAHVSTELLLLSTTTRTTVLDGLHPTVRRQRSLTRTLCPPRQECSHANRP